tara:strand:+ start:20789 stop:21034 length:246 start_codon:yes stop_codon:yes gene_type:complete
VKHSQYSLINIHKLPPKLVELLKAAESTSVVGFGVTQEQQDFMLLKAILENKNSDFFEGLTQEVVEYFLTLSKNLSVSSNG